MHIQPRTFRVCKTENNVLYLLLFQENCSLNRFVELDQKAAGTERLSFCWRSGVLAHSFHRRHASYVKKGQLMCC